MLATADIVSGGVRNRRPAPPPNLVVDPVMAASGTRRTHPAGAGSRLNIEDAPAAGRNGRDAECGGGRGAVRHSGRLDGQRARSGKADCRTGRGRGRHQGWALQRARGDRPAFSCGDVHRACGAARRVRRGARHGMHVCVGDCRRPCAWRRYSGRRRSARSATSPARSSIRSRSAAARASSITSGTPSPLYNRRPYTWAWRHESRSR